MPLQPEHRLGPYQIVAPLGAGGMGEVFRARDTRLDRTVAIKVLPSELASDPQFRERFDREARAISQLTHPNICTLHDVGSADGVDFLVLEYLDGVTLEARLASGPLPFAEAMRVAVDIAGALAAAHRAGIVHRDLKPGNVMLTKSGAKLLDFGLAKGRAPAVVSSGLSMLPTTPPTITAQGAILGTFQYMAPEQIEGLDADARTDIFAFGCVLYEMVTGQKAFEGKTRASLLGAILKDEPPAVSTLQPVASAAVDRVVATCLEKDPDDRWQTARDLQRELQWAAHAGRAPTAAAAVNAAATTSSLTRERVAWIAIAVALGSAAAALWWRTAAPVSEGVSRFTVSLASAPLAAVRQAMAISRDGRTIVYRGQTERGVAQLFTRRVDSFEPVALRGTDAADVPFFSPDGQWVGFFADGKLRKVPISGGPAATICDASQGASLGAAWLPGGTIVFTTMGQTGLLRVPDEGGTPERLTTVDVGKGERGHRWPSAIPGRRAVVFSITMVGQSPDDSTIAVKSLDTGEQHVVQNARGTRPEVLPTGHLVSGRAGSLVVAPFDLKRLQATGPALPMVEGVAAVSAVGNAVYDVSAGGSLVYMPATTMLSERLMTWVDRAGTAHDVPLAGRQITDVALSPDGRRAALVIDSSNGSDVWVYSFDRGGLTRITFGEGVPNNLLWTDDGRRILYSSFRNGSYEIFWRPSDGSGAEEQLFKGEVSGNFPRSWSPDGKWLLFQRGTGALSNDLWLLPMDGDRKPKPFLTSPFNETQARFSPDGRWVAYQSNESGRDEIYVRPAPEASSGGKWQVSIDGGTRPRWSADGRELIYRNGDRMIAASVSAAPTFAASTPVQLFEGNYGPSFDRAADGRFLMIKGSPAQNASELHVVLDWFSEVSARVPSR